MQHQLLLGKNCFQDRLPCQFVPEGYGVTLTHQHADHYTGLDSTDLGPGHLGQQPEFDARPNHCGGIQYGPAGRGQAGSAGQSWASAMQRSQKRLKVRSSASVSSTFAPWTVAV